MDDILATIKHPDFALYVGVLSILLAYLSPRLVHGFEQARKEGSEFARVIPLLRILGPVATATSALFLALTIVLQWGPFSLNALFLALTAVIIGLVATVVVGALLKPLGARGAPKSSGADHVAPLTEAE